MRRMLTAKHIAKCMLIQGEFKVTILFQPLWKNSKANRKNAHLVSKDAAYAEVFFMMVLIFSDWCTTFKIGKLWNFSKSTTENICVEWSTFSANRTSGAGLSLFKGLSSIALIDKAVQRAKTRRLWYADLLHRQNFRNFYQIRSSFGSDFESRASIRKNQNHHRKNFSICRVFWDQTGIFWIGFWIFSERLKQYSNFTFTLYTVCSLLDNAAFA